MPKKILVIEDEPDVIKILEHYLGTKGYSVTTAQDGQQGLDKLKKERPDLILLDVLMPVMDGFGFYKIIKKDAQFAQVPVVILTARGGMRGTFEALEVDDFIAKPFDADDLMGKVDNALRRRVLLLSQEPYVNEKVKSGFESYGFETEIAQDETSLFNKGFEAKYSVYVIYLPLVSSAPVDFIKRLKSLRNRNARVVVFSDEHVKGMSGAKPEVLGELRRSWESAGADVFYDARLADKVFREMIKEAL